MTMSKWDRYTAARDALASPEASQAVLAYQHLRAALVALDTLPRPELAALADRLEMALLKYPDDISPGQQLQNDVLRAYHALVEDVEWLSGHR